MTLAVNTEPDPRSPQAVPPTSGWTPGVTRFDRGAEYGAPAMTGVLAWSPQHVPGRADDAGQDIAGMDFGHVIGGAPAIGVVNR